MTDRCWAPINRGAKLLLQQDTMGQPILSKYRAGPLSPAANIDYIIRSRNASTADIIGNGNSLNFDMPFSLVPGQVDCRIEIAKPMGFI